ncbi:hypothetical protein [Agrococcus sp. SCSIO52902]|uniref:hypothetical protein n=1 Tax=Agrococcus sp. SCSIO52902 TaxID=2933290 RepID=UPI001FF5B710|nr:hypothetical protein [Agrococcus sp. SCSIO52902]UOV99843.1 hypothetical protein MU522_07725 [Agrococcus sp. SCSIO52902]
MTHEGGPADRPSTGSAGTGPDSPVGDAQSRSSDGSASEAGAADAAEPQPVPLVIRRRGRRVSTEPSPGYTGEPPVERQERGSENDEQLRRDVPPHWG